MASWKQGQSGNAKGRPKGSRHKINERALALIDEVLAEKDATLAKAALTKVRDNDPAAFWRMITGLMPKDLHVKGDHTVTHIERAVSETAAWIEGIIGEKPGRRSKKPLPN